MLKKKCDTNIADTIKLAKQMIQLAQNGDEHREDPGCGILYGILLDSGYRILDLAQREKQNHIEKGWCMKTPVIDLGFCILCKVCIEVAPQAFQINDAGFVETLPLDDYSDEDIHEAIISCPKNCITWE